MSGLGYGDAKRRRDRADPRSRSVSRGGDKRAKGKKDKKDKKEPKVRNVEPLDDPPRKRGARSRSRDRMAAPLQARNAADNADEAVLGRTPSRRENFSEPGEQKRAWREELGDKEQEEEDVPADGIVQMEDDESVEQTLAASRARREALIAKWVNSTIENPDTPLGGDTNASSDSDAEGSDDQREAPATDDPYPVDEESLKAKKEVMRFIVQQKAEHDGDMFGEDAENEDALRATAKGTAAAISQTGASADDWDDVEGYYKAKIGEKMDGRYVVSEDMCGKGVFSNVVKAKDQVQGLQVAIKVMRCNDMMRKAAEKEVEVLERLNKSDEANKKHVIKLLRHFSYRGHLCLVFECMWDNLRVALKKYTKDKGMSLQAVRAYTKQLLIALRHIHRCSIIHADIKPDNILISAGHNVVKICDLGSATELSEVEITPYLVSRFYRAPEIILGMKYGIGIDVFAMGGSLYELFTGKIMFPGKSNNDMLRLFMEFKGKIPRGLIKAGQLWKQHFDEKLDFKYLDTNKLTKKKVMRTITDCSAKRSILDVVMGRVGSEKQKSQEADDILYCKKAKQFADLIEKMTALDPEKRVSAHDALQHAFLAEPGIGSKPKENAKGGQPQQKR